MGKVDYDLVKLIVKKFGLTFMKDKIVEPEQFIDYIVYLVCTGFDLDIFKSLVNCGCIDDCSYFGHNRYYDEFETAAKATKHYLDKCTINNLEDLKKSVDNNG